MVEERVYSGTCLGVVPIHAGVLAIGILQMVYEGTTVGVFIHAGMDDRPLRFYLAFSLHALNVLAALMLIFGVMAKIRQMFVPWLLMTVMIPTMFLLNLVTQIIFLQFTAAGALIIQEAIPAIIIFYCCSVVYDLYSFMEANASQLPCIQESATMYGTSNVVIVSETEDRPPSYSSVVEATKQLMAQ